MNNQSKTKKAIEFIVGAIALALAHLATLFIFQTLIPGKILEYDSTIWNQYYLTIAASYILIFFTFSQPLNLKTRNRPMELLATVRNCLLTYALIAVLLLFTKNQIIESRYLFLSSSIIFTVLSLGGRFFTKRALMSKSLTNRFASNCGIITLSKYAKDFTSAIQPDWSKNVTAIALLDAKYQDGALRIEKLQEENGSLATKTVYTPVEEVNGVPVVANAESLMGWILTAPIDEMYIHLSADYDNEEVSMLIEALEDAGITVNFSIPSLRKIVKKSKYDNLGCEVRNEYPFAVFSPAVHDEKLLTIKRITDLIGSIIGSFISIILIAFVAIPLKKESPGPLIFKQPRVGKNGRIFNIYKIRSMYVDAEERKKALMEQNDMDGFMFKMEDDPRITRVGKFIRKYSIDEWPQFWNVLKGDMSLVGTRPPTIDEFEQYERHHKRRLSMKPGITGMWQVSGRSDIQNFEEVVKLDCEYIDNWSIWLDAKILIKTIGVVITHKGAK